MPFDPALLQRPEVEYRCPSCYGPLPGYTLLVGVLRLAMRAYKKGYHHGFRDARARRNKGRTIGRDLRQWIDDKETVWFEPAPTDTRPRRQMALQFLVGLMRSDIERVTIEHLYVLDLQRRRRDGARWADEPAITLDWDPDVGAHLARLIGPPIRRRKFYLNPDAGLARDRGTPATPEPPETTS